MTFIDGVFVVCFVCRLSISFWVVDRGLVGWLVVCLAGWLAGWLLLGRPLLLWFTAPATSTMGIGLPYSLQGCGSINSTELMATETFDADDINTTTYGFCFPVNATKDELSLIHI